MQKITTTHAKNANSETVTVISMEACTDAHHFARQLLKQGHTPKLMPPQFVIPYRLQGGHGKNGANDAAAICEAVIRPTMRSVRSKPKMPNPCCAFIELAKASWKNVPRYQPHSWIVVGVRHRAAAKGRYGAQRCASDSSTSQVSSPCVPARRSPAASS